MHLARIVVLACVAVAGLAAQDPGPPVRAGTSGVSHPRLLNEIAPAYPRIARSALVSGAVVIEVVVDETGQVSDATIARANPLLDDAALEAVRGWQFEPLIVNGGIRRFATTVTVRFELLHAEAPVPPPGPAGSPSGMPADFAVVYDDGCIPGNRTGGDVSVFSSTIRATLTAATHDLEPLYRQLLETGLLSRTDGLRVWQVPTAAGATVRADGVTVTVAAAHPLGFVCSDRAGAPLYGVAVRHGGTWRRLWPPIGVVPPDHEPQVSATRGVIQKILAAK